MKGQPNDPFNEVKSLVGKIDKTAMGKSTTKSMVKSSGKKKLGKIRQSGSRLEYKQGNILEEKFDETLLYHPKTNENRAIYQNFLGKMYELVTDQPPEILMSMADNILAIILSDTSQHLKKAETESIIGEKLKEQKFIDLSNVAHSLTDYRVDDDEMAREEIVNIDEDEESEGMPNDEENSGEQEFDPEAEIEEEMEEDQHEIHNGRSSNVDTQIKSEMQGERQVDPNTIDAHWLQAKLLQHYEPNEAIRLERQILQILNAKSKLEVENHLLSILNYEKYDLIKILLENRKNIYYCVKYHQCSHQKEREVLFDQMKAHGINLGKKNVKNTAKSTDSLEKRSSKHQIQKLEEEINFQRVAKDQDINRINKKILDLSIHDSQDKTAAKKQEYKFKLPEGAEKIEKIGYEEIHIPAKSKRIQETLIEIDTLPQWMQGVFIGIKRFNPIQSKVLEHALHSHQNMLVCAPTSSGKTNIALLSILETISKYIDENNVIDVSKFKIVYIAPMKALVAEITGNLSNRLNALGITVKELTGDMHLSKMQIENTQVIISTPEKWDIITRKAGDKLFVEQVKLLIIDEIHLLADQRGPVLQSIISRTIRQAETLQTETRIVGLSATLPNYKDVGLALRVNPKQGLFHFDQSYRPIPLEQRYLGVTEKNGVRKMLMMNQILYEKVMQRVTSQQMIIFVHSRRDTVRTANALKQTAFAKNQLSRIMKPDSESKKIIEDICEKETINSKDLKQLITSGIGIHHAGLSRADRDLVEQLFADRHFNILISTATLAWGVNLPAHTVIIKGTQVYSPEEGRWVQLSLQDVMQMLGRAGRPRYDEEGEGIIITGYEEVRYYLNLLNMQIPLQSQMINSLPDQLNAEVVLSNVCSIRDGVNWLAYTYFYIRMLKNPKYYSIPIEELEEDPSLLRRRVNLVHSAFTILERNGLIHYDRKNGAVASTFLGKIASYYYIKHPSITIYNNNLKSNSTLIDLFKIFAMSIQFKYLSVREEEKVQLKKLIETVPVPIKGSIEDTTTKISALLQAHISRLQLQGFALNIDKVYVTQSASRIMRALFEICLKRSWGQAAQRTLELAKMIDKSMWSCLNPLRQFKNIPEYVLARLQKKQQFSWESFYQMTPQEIGDLTKFPKLGKILHKFVHHIPRVSIDAYAQPLTRNSLKIQATIKSDFVWEDDHHGKEEPFWLFVLDCNQQNILYSYYFTLTKKADTYSTMFIVPLYQIMHPLYFIKILSDRWICSENILPLSFKNMILPSKFLPSNQILDLQPLPAAHLDPIAKDLKINYLNQIQTQVYNAFVHSQSNVFLGASEGSGKFTLAIFAMNQKLQAHEKVVVILSNMAIVNKKHGLLSKVFNKKKVGKTVQDLTKDAAILQGMDLIVTTAQAWDVLSRRWKSRKGFNEIGLIVVDNLHQLNQNQSTLEVVVSRMRSIASLAEGKPFRIIGLSTSAADYREMAEWIGAPLQTTFNFYTSVRPNIVEVIFNSYDQTIRQSRLHLMQKNLIQTVLHYNRSTLVIVNDKKQAKLSALDLVSQLSSASDSNNKRLKRISDDQMRIFSKKISDTYLLHIIEYGIGYIYEGMNEIEREIIEKLFQVEAITIMISTHALKWQFDYKVFMVAILDTTYYDVTTKRHVDYPISDMLQFMSLSSLSEKDKHNKGSNKEFHSSKFIIYCQTAKKAYYKKFLFQPYPVESSLNLHLANHLNTSIVSGSIKNKQDCVDWLTWTFLYRRLTCNPNYYNMDNTSEEGISAYLSEIVQNHVEYLSGIKCIEVDQENQMDLTATNLAIICSYYYIKVQTLAGFVSKIAENMKLKNLIEIVSQAEQLISYGYKPKQYETISLLLVPFSEKAINKVHGLLLLHFYRVALPQELLHESRAILPVIVKLTHALVDIISSYGYLKPIILCMQLCQMLVQGMWITDSILMQFMDAPLVRVLSQQHDVKDINAFLNMNEDLRSKVCKGKDIEKIAAACNRFPMVEMRYQLQQQAEEKEDEAEAELQEVSLTVTLTRDDELEHELVLSNYYPAEKEEFWWVIVGDKKNNKVLTTKRALVQKEATLSLVFQCDRNVESNKVVVYALCDSYVGCDQAEELQVGRASQKCD